jgi:anti-sigma factor RsiW
MSCEQQWLEAISAYMDGVLPLEEEHRVHGHLRECPPCAQMLVDWVPIVRALASLPSPEPLANMWLKLEAQLKHDAPFAKRRVFVEFKRPMVGWAAACVMGLVGVGLYWSHQAPVVPVADVNMYWSQHEEFSHDSGVPTLYGPEMHAIEASYHLNP